ncbi:MAG: hypothetical protein II983_02215 [Firmicutes bacterium]|nr:hypothetical protein [Bacillota bacterium]
MLIIYKDNEDYYDSQLQYLGEAKEAYDYVVTCCKAQGIAVSQKRYTRYEDDMHEDEQLTKDITELSFRSTQEMVCEYREVAYEGWGGKNWRMEFCGSKYVVVKPKSEWNAPAPQASAQVEKTGTAKVKVILNRTNQELNEKYRFSYADDNKELWMIRGNNSLLDATLHLENAVLGTLDELVTTPIKMILLRNDLTANTGKRFVCKCASDIVVMDDGKEYHRQFVFLAEESKLNQTNTNAMGHTSILTIRKMQNLADGKETVRLWFNQQNPYLEFRVLTK